MNVISTLFLLSYFSLNWSSKKLNYINIFHFQVEVRNFWLVRVLFNYCLVCWERLWRLMTSRKSNVKKIVFGVNFGHRTQAVIWKLRLCVGNRLYDHACISFTKSSDSMKHQKLSVNFKLALFPFHHRYAMKY